MEEKTITEIENKELAEQIAVKSELIEFTDYQECKNDSFKIDQSGKIDAKFQAQKVKAGIPVQKVPVTFFNEYGDEFLIVGLLYDKSNESYVMFKADNRIHVRHATEGTRKIYGNGRYELGYVFHELLLDSFSMRIVAGEKIKDKLINKCKYITSSYEIIEKNTFAKRFSDMTKGEKTLITIAGLGGIGIGIIIAKILGI